MESELPWSSERWEAARVAADQYLAWRQQSPIWSYQTAAQFDIPGCEPGGISKRLRLFENRVRAAAGSRSCLFHGTTYPLSVLVANRIEVPWFGERVVSLTRTVDVAVHFATLFRDDSEERGAVLVLDRDTLRTRYRIEPASHVSTPQRGVKDGEFEERINSPVENLSRHIVDVVWGPRNWC